MIIIDTKLKARENEGKPIQIALIGAGEMAIGLVNQIERYIPGMRIAVIYNRTRARAEEAYQTAGVDNALFSQSSAEVDDAIRAGRAAIAEGLDAALEADQVDVVVEMTGAINFSYDVILKAFQLGKHVVTFNAEIDATIGPYLQQKAREAGVRYTLGDGDQPGVTLNLYRQVKAMGFKPLVCGNIKGMLDHYRNPETQKGFAEKSGLSVNMVTSFADGTKVSLEQASIANATGMGVARRGMLAIESDQHIDTLTGAYDLDMLESRNGVVEMVIGGQPGPGVFVFASTDDPVSQRFLAYGKLGNGPLYSFYVPYHLLFFEFPFSIARLIDFDDGTLDAIDFSVQVTTTAKKDLKAGEVLDGMGGFTSYGECENSSVFLEQKMLPIGLSEDKKLIRDVAKDTPITWDDIEKTDLSLVEQAYKSVI
ncbi:MAG: SAF domain-containing protein [Verrucomicrobiota bacterium]